MLNVQQKFIANEVGKPPWTQIAIEDSNQLLVLRFGELEVCHKDIANYLQSFTVNSAQLKYLLFI